MSWANMSNDPSTDERVLKDAQRTIERIVDAMRTALDDELANQQLEYDQLFGLNSQQFAMYQTLVMTFFQDHQMLASLNLKRSRPDLSQGVPEQKRAYLMEVIAERVSSAVPVVQNQQFNQMQNVGQQGQNPGVQSSGAWPQQPQPAAQAPSGNWLESQPAATQAAPGDWLNQASSKERPAATAWPTNNEDSTTWTLKPGGGQPPAIPAASSETRNGSNGAAWAAASNSWPTPETQNSGSGSWPTVPEQPKVAQPENQWSGAQTGAPGWADQPGVAGKQQLPPAAWPASNSGAAPAPANPIALPQPPVAPPGVARPNFNSPIGDSGMSGTWTLPPGSSPGFTKPAQPPGQPPAPAWDSNNRQTGGAPPAAAWNEPPSQGTNNNGSYETSQQSGSTPPAAAWAAAPVTSSQDMAAWNQPAPSAPSTPSQEMAAWNQPTPAAPVTSSQELAAWNQPAPPSIPPAPAWSAPNGAMPVPESSSGQPTQPWQTPSSGAQPWQADAPVQPSAPVQPAWQAPPASVTQSGLSPQLPAPAAPAWEAPPASLTQPAQSQPAQAWQPPTPASQQPWQQPAASQPPQMPSQPPQMPTQPQPHPWQNPGTTSGATAPWTSQPTGQSGGQQPYAQQQLPGQMPMQNAPQMPPPPPPLPMQQMPPPPVLPAPQEQSWTPPDSPWGGAEGNGAAPWTQNSGNGLPPPAGSPPAQYQVNNGQQNQYPNQQGYPPNGQGQPGMPPQGAPYQMPGEDLSINFNQNNPPAQNAGGTLSGVLRQMRAADINKQKREEEERKENYNPNTAW